MLDNYGFIGVMALIALAFHFIGVGAAWLLRPRRPDPIKNSSYECGVETIGDTWVQFRAQYYLFALIFVIFDIEAMFLFPFAVAFNQIGLFALLGELHATANWRRVAEEIWPHTRGPASTPMGERIASWERARAAADPEWQAWPEA